MSDCIFCKIAGGEIPSATIYEDNDFRVILDLGPASKGHALILPKEHYANLYEIPDELAGKAIVLAKKIITAMTEVLGCDGYNIVQNNGEDGLDMVNGGQKMVLPLPVQLRKHIIQKQDRIIAHQFFNQFNLCKL